MKKRWIALALLAVFFIWGFFENQMLTVTEYEIADERISEAFDGFRILHISDFHNATFGEENEKLLSRISELEPDIVVFTGDFVDSSRTDIPVALAFAEKAVQIVPCYYVAGNHEAKTEEFAQLEAGLRDAGVTVLRNESVSLMAGDSKLLLTGVDDPSFVKEKPEEQVMAEALAQLRQEDAYQILLSHRPELFRTYVESGVDLVFTGHAHGGMFRLPLLGGLVAPNQGIFPKYEEGSFTEGDTTMIVSRGVGNSIIPIRVNNPPEIVVAVLKRK